MVKSAGSNLFFLVWYFVFYSIVCYFLTNGTERLEEEITKCDMGEGSKNVVSDVLFECLIANFVFLLSYWFLLKVAKFL